MSPLESWGMAALIVLVACYGFWVLAPVEVRQWIKRGRR